MLDVSVKTLEGQNKSYSVPESTTVKQFKEKIASSIEIPVDRQRLIFQGRVLQDEKKLTEYDVHGKVIHVVQRAPPGSRPPPSSSSASSNRSSSTPGGAAGASFSFGSFGGGMPGEPLSDPNHVQNIVQQVLSGMGESGRHAHVTSRTSTDGSAVDVHINLNQSSARAPSEAQQRIKMIQRMLRSAREALHKYENPNETESASTTEESQTTESSSSGTTSGSVGANSSSVQSGTTDNATPTNTSAQTREPNPETPVLGNLMNEVFELQQRMQPLMERYQRVLIDDPQLESGSEECIGTQRLVNTVSEVMHHIGHAYHAISDIMLDCTSSRPRELTAPPVPSPPPTAVIHQTIPVQAQISLNTAMAGSPRTSRRNQASAATTTTTSSTATPATAANNTNGSQTNSATRGQAPFGIRLPFQGGNMPTSGTTIASSNPYVFMEVGPNTMSFNSVTAHLVSDSADEHSDDDHPVGGSTTTSSTRTSTTNATGGTPTTGAAAANGQNPVMQNIIQMALQAASQRIAGQGTPQGSAIIIGANGNLPNSQTAAANMTTTATSTSSASAARTSATTTGTNSSRTNGSTRVNGGGNGRSGNGMPQIPGLLPFELRNPDPYLPCQSRHFQALQAELQRQNQNSESTVSNIISALLNQPNPHLQGGAPTTVHSAPRQPAPAPPTGAATTTTSSSTTRAANPFAALFTPPGGAATQNTSSRPADTQDFARRLGEILAQGRSASASGDRTNSQRASSNPTGASNPPMSDAMFSQLVSQIGANFSQAMIDGSNSPTLADFLQSVSDFNVGEGLLPELLVVVGQNMTFSDLLQVFFGSSQPLGRLQQPLQAFVQEKVLRGREPTQAVIDEAVEEAIDNLDDYFTAIVTESEGDIEDNINLHATLQEFFRVQLTAILKIIVDSPENDPHFADALFYQCRTAIHEDVALLRFCLTSGIRGVERIVRNRIRAMSDVDNPMVQSWVENMASQQLYQLVPQITVQNSQIQRYIIRQTQRMESSPRPSESSSHMSTESAAVAEDLSSVREAPVCQSLQETDRCTPQSVEMTECEEGAAQTPTVVNGNSSESWQQVLPEDWVPIISRDIQTQRRQAQQQPFSDAYIAGVPAKRRKMMSNSQVPNTGNLSTVIPETIKRAVAATQSTPLTSIESVERDAAENHPLQTAYEQQVMSDITDRLKTDPDYSPDKYPNSDEYFTPGLNTKK
ncbi:large proline-rich protein BAG6-like [Tubulanus polymorphus]|uniref:large proline-rich protein BAG6-like n=1 Tax=Tubulanus polymorphus TaxID=672921 RepID=UPI003DA4C306